MRRTARVACIALLGAVCAQLCLARAQATASSSSSSASSKTTSTKKKKHRSRREPKQKAPTPDRIEEIQSALARNGDYAGTPTRKWDATTVAAMQKFQGEHGLEATGKIDALSLQKLGLGSEIAGVSAPRPVTPSAAKPWATGSVPDTPKPQSPQSPSGLPPAATSPAASPAPTPTAKPPIPQIQ